MNEQLTLLKEKYNLDSYKTNTLYGNINNYQVVINFSSTKTSDCFIKIHTNVSHNKKFIEKYLESFKDKYRLSSWALSMTTITLHLISLNRNKWFEKAEAAILGITEELKSKEFNDSAHCLQCGEKIFSSITLLLNGTPITYCKKCGNIIKEKEKEKRKIYKNANSSKAIWGSIVGTLLGCIIYGLLGYFIYETAKSTLSIFIFNILGSFGISYLSSASYDKFKKGNDINKFKCNMILSYVSLFFATSNIYINYILFNECNPFLEGDYLRFLSLFLNFIPSVFVDSIIAMIFGSITIIPYNLYLRKVQ